MKGTLIKTEQGWVVRYRETTPLSITTETLPLHPDHIEMMDTCFTSKFTRKVEFEMVTETYEDGKGCPYAKLLHHSVESNEMIDHIGDANEMVENYNQIIGKPLEDYVREKHSQDRCMGFIDGYNKAQENLYTKQDVIDAVVRMYDIFMDNTLEAKMLRLKGVSWHIQNTLESLKQNKQ